MLKSPICRIAALSLTVAVAAAAGGCGTRLPDFGPEERRRLALVIGVSDYPGFDGADLNNPTKDAQGVKEALTKLGFEVTHRVNLTKDQISTAVIDFGDSLQSTDVALFFFSGHGVGLGGENFLLPSDYRGAYDATVLESRALKVSTVQRAIDQAQFGMILLDACRNNASIFQTKGMGTGFEKMDARGTAVFFATQAGAVAQGRNGRDYSLFTAKLLEALTKPNLTAGEVFDHVKDAVDRESKGRQIPSVVDNVTGGGLDAFVFRRESTPTTPPIALQPTTPPQCVDVRLPLTHEAENPDKIVVPLEFGHNTCAEPFAFYIELNSYDGTFQPPANCPDGLCWPIGMIDPDRPDHSVRFPRLELLPNTTTVDANYFIYKSDDNSLLWTERLTISFLNS